MTKMLKFVVGLGLAGGVAAASEPKVDVTSFEIVDNRNPRIAEFCGLVSGMTTDSVLVRVTVDERSRNPAVYTATAGKDGKFCIIVATYSGTAEATLNGATGENAPAARGLLTRQNRRQRRRSLEIDERPAWSDQFPVLLG